MAEETQIIEFTPGDRIPVEVLADEQGNVPHRAQGVSFVGENRDMAQVELVSAVGDADAVLLVAPREMLTDGTTTYSAGESVGVGSVIGGSGLHLWLPYASDFDPATQGGGSPAIGDDVEFNTNGDIQMFAGNAPFPFGRVVGTGGKDFFNKGVVQVRLFR